MADEPRRRMSRHIRLVLLGSLPTALGCGGCGGTTSTPPADQPQPMEEIEEIDEDPPPEGTGHFFGAPFVGWWMLSHPPIVTHRLVPRAQIASGGYTRTSSGYYSRAYYGRSAWLYGSSSRPANSSGVVRGGFGSTGHAAAAGA
ncbi:MAG TPA: hypothetical protein VHR66_16020 [Gemmataceae bacterium]|jgi:hypothetical protein|nr:hypothetical protein [Gemmataceae bacterium]